MNEKAKENIKKLREECRYDEIFTKYGIKSYKKYVPLKYRKADKAKLIKEGRYEEIFHKYGKSEYNKLLIKAMYDEIRQEQGAVKAFLWKMKKQILRGARETALLATATSLSLTAGMAVGTNQKISENKEENRKVIEEYDKNISNYAGKFKNMSDIQIFMKVMDDMWQNIKGYGKPEKDIFGLWELDLSNEEGIGVCRNMASDIAKKLNKINPEYNARILTVKMGDEGCYNIADIKRNIIENNETVANAEEGQQQSSKIEDITKELIGNHMVTLVDVAEDNITLVLDPTNPGIGIYSDGKIVMLNSPKEDGIQYDAKEYSSAVLIKGGIEGIVNTSADYIKSYKDSNLTFEQIDEKYGCEAQNTALIEVRARKLAMTREEEFRESLKVENYQSSIAKNGELNVTELENQQVQNVTKENIETERQH